MSFTITFEPRTRIAGVTPTTVEIEDVAKAWLEVHGLIESDEQVRITENGRPISWEELRDRANRKAN